MKEEEPEEGKDVIRNGMICFLPTRRTVKIGQVLDIPYRSPQDAEFDAHKHKLDVYLPIDVVQHVLTEAGHDQKLIDDENPKSGKCPVVIFIHGGGWQRGHRRSAAGLYQNVGRTFAASGFVSVVPSYRLTAPPRNSVIRAAGLISIILTTIVLLSLSGAKLYTFLSWLSLLIYLLVWLLAIFMAYLVLRKDLTSPEDSIHPRHANDVADAVAWTQKNVQKLGGDPSRIFLCGHSAGGHLVALLALDRKYLDSRGFDFSGLVGVLAISGVYCDKLFSENVLARNSYMPRAFGSDPTKWPDAFPLNHCHGDSPPFLLLNASIDIGLADHARALEKSLKAKGVKVNRFMFSHTNHITIVSRIGGRTMAFQACGRVCAERLELLYLALSRMLGSSSESSFKIPSVTSYHLDEHTLDIISLTVRLDSVTRTCVEFISEILSTPPTQLLDEGEYVDDPEGELVVNNP
eukprot:TRINITY_DN6242_c0_g1_i2.p1 TRINITY_DN6242_c0_g1~~TRINITY_DN6242_c0_g1_i2.p1  ORF type:complete len:462 (-),score=91.18 TRINITY_DN6242_c0_g1_i2:59-1444(-)